MIHAAGSPGSDRAPATVLITGASSGLGRALANAYAAPGRVLVLHGRHPRRLEAAATECEALGATVRRWTCDFSGGREWIADLEALVREAPVDLAILNAGLASTTRGEVESLETVDELVRVNIGATLAACTILSAAMRQRGGGQIALVSSLQAWYGMPVAPAYCATKAALKAYGEALRPTLARDGVRVSVVLPGFVDTPMSRRFPGPRHQLMTAEDAAGRIRRGLERDRPRIAFPFPVAFAARMLAVLPANWSQAIVARLGY